MLLAFTDLTTPVTYINGTFTVARDGDKSKDGDTTFAILKLTVKNAELKGKLKVTYKGTCFASGNVADLGKIVVTEVNGNHPITVSPCPTIKLAIGGASAINGLRDVSSMGDFVGVSATGILYWKTNSSLAASVANEDKWMVTGAVGATDG